MDSIYSRCKIRPTGDGKYILLEVFRYKGITIPKGYKTNGADIPRVFWSFIPPFSPLLLPAIILHDYLCSLGEYKKADKWFKMILVDLKIRRWKREVLVRGVKSYHFLRYGI